MRSEGSNTRLALPDQAARDRFCSELETNFSVIAPAGVGKTTSIVERILRLAQADRRRLNDPLLPRLVVVTYTEKAANEMITRVRDRFDQELPHAEAHAHLAQAYIGTIHGFCQRLIRLAGPLLGIPGEAAIVPQMEALWWRYRRECPAPQIPLPPDLERAFAIHGRWSDVFALAKRWPVDALGESFALPGLPPRVDGSELLAFEAKGRGGANIGVSQANFRRWEAHLGAQMATADPRPCEEPVLAGGSREFKEAWPAAFQPLRVWKSAITRYLAAQVAADFARFRRRSGELGFDDIIGLARRLLETPESRDLLRARNWRVILDEAQDTDPSQFVVLTEVARPVGAPGVWLEDGESVGPRPGHFSMVGDMQQSIYSDRADLVRYRAVHTRLIESGGAEAVFSVTMRCPVAVVDFLNTTFPNILEAQAGDSRQVDYVPLETPAGARDGQVVRVALPPPDPSVPKKAPIREAGFARAFAAWWAERRPQDFGAQRWSDVAILCPRNGWLERLAGALAVEGVAVQRASRRAIKAEDPVFAWFASILAVFARPRDAFELYGVLRDILGISDDALARFVRARIVSGQPHPLRIDVPPSDGAEPVESALGALHALLQTVRRRPLYEAVELLLRELQLEARLEASNLVEMEEARRSLARLRAATAEAEAEQMTLIEWADACRQSLTEKSEETTAHEDAVVLLTAHKSKGLGFQAVVLPCFFHTITQANPTYPRCIRGAGGGLEFQFSGDDVDDTAKARAALRRREVQERLLYVALTRVKHSLVLVDDAAWWDGLRSYDPSFGEMLTVGTNRAAWDALPRELRAIEVKPVDEPEAEVERQLEFEIERSHEPIATGWRRITPSSLQIHDPSTWLASEVASQDRDEPDRLSHPEFPEEGRTADPAAYGNWWHDTMETAPWSLDEDALRIHLANALNQTCPPEQKTRGAREIEQFLSSSLAAKLIDPAWSVWTEVPFLAGEVPEKRGYEGYIDLVAREKASGQWMVVDWKTDRLRAEDPSEALWASYAPQLQVYAKALETAFGCAGEAGLYSTVTGAWIVG